MTWLKKHFIKATEEFNTFEKNVPAPYFRRTFTVNKNTDAKITIAVCGFYELFLNGKKITRGFLSPYISNTNDYIYYDEYEVSLLEGENTLGILLGNGYQNNPGGAVWDFDKADFRSAPTFALSVTDGDKVILTSDDSFKTAPSPILSDDYRFGEYYDANCEIVGWCESSFDDSSWKNALPAVPPRGELRLADISPITKECEIKPVSITPYKDSFIYDFGVSNAGICRLSINGEKGQKIDMRFADSLLDDGDLNIAQIWFRYDSWERDKDIVHKDTYICKGEDGESYEPSFTYHGFRYVKVSGITPEQATEGLLTYLVYHTGLTSLGDFSCSDPIANTLQELTRRSIKSNFHHFPTDCPQREKNGWTADAALSSEAALLNFDPERNYREWMRNICKAQNEQGALPGIVPTSGWGFHWGNGPAWDSVLTYLPYFVYIYRGETDMIKESAESFIRYLKYLRTRVDNDGLLSIGLGDWCHIGITTPQAPLIVTDSIITMDIANKMSVMFDAIGDKESAYFAKSEAQKYRASIREKLISYDDMTVFGSCQSSQAMALFYGVFDESEKNAAFEKLLSMIHSADDHMDVGVLGGRVIFHVLSDFGYSDLAYKMITREDFPSYGNWLIRGATTLWENFDKNGVASMNHHFWGDISAWFIKRIAGVRVNPSLHKANEVIIAPAFINALESASAYHITPFGKVSSEWKRDGENLTLTIEIPEKISASLILEEGYRLENGNSSQTVAGGSYRITRIK